MELGKLLKTIRVYLDLTQHDLSEKLGISSNYLSLLESNKRNPSSEVILKIAQQFKISKDALDFLCTEIPPELDKNGAEKYQDLQNNIVTLLIFQLQEKHAKKAGNKKTA